MRTIKFSEETLKDSLILFGLSHPLSHYAEPLICPQPDAQLNHATKKALWIVKVDALQRQVYEIAELFGVKNKKNEWPTVSQVEKAYKKFNSEHQPDVVADVSLKEEMKKISDSAFAMYQFMNGANGVYSKLKALEESGLSLEDLMLDNHDRVMTKISSVESAAKHTLSKKTLSLIDKFYKELTAITPHVLASQHQVKQEQDGFLAHDKQLPRVPSIEKFMYSIFSGVNKAVFGMINLSQSSFQKMQQTKEKFAHLKQHSRLSLNKILPQKFQKKAKKFITQLAKATQTHSKLLLTSLNSAANKKHDAKPRPKK